MMFVRLDCMIRLNPKIATLRSTTCWYFVCCLSYANQYETGGYVPKHVMPSLWSSMLEPRFQFRVHTDALIQAGILIDAGGAYRIHDYFDYQVSLEQAQRRRLTDRVRQQRRREKLRAEQISEDRWQHAGRGRHGTCQEGVGGGSPIVTGVADMSSYDFAQTSACSSHVESTHKVREIISQVQGKTEVRKGRHGVTTHAVTHQSIEETYRSRSDCLCKDESSPASRESVRVVDLHAFKAFAQKSGWGALSEAMLARFGDLDPFPGESELTLVQETLQRQVITFQREIKSPAAYALRILHNRRKQKTADSAASSRSLTPQTQHYSSHKESVEIRESKMELYLEVADALGDNAWVASMTTGTIDELWNRGARSTPAILKAIAQTDAKGQTCQYGADWSRVFEYVDKAAQLAKPPSTRRNRAGS